MKLVAATVLLMVSAAVAAPTPEYDHRPVLSSVCENMIPGHGNAQPSTKPSPYSISATQTSVNGGQTVRVHITGTEEFKGVYIQARRGNTPVGEFLLPGGESNAYTLSDCPPGHKNAYSYISRTTGLHTLDVDWKAPNEDGEIVFRATFVKSFSEFWVGIESSKVIIETTTSTDNAVAA